MKQVCVSWTRFLTHYLIFETIEAHIRSRKGTKCHSGELTSNMSVQIYLCEEICRSAFTSFRQRDESPFDVRPFTYVCTIVCCACNDNSVSRLRTALVIGGCV